MSVIVRFAPSPTGPLHLGGARTALFNYLFAHQAGGRAYLRIEDTDRERSKPEFEQNILESLDWLGLKFERQQPFRQSECGEVYRLALEKLIAAGAAYVSKEEQTEQGRTVVIRFKNPGRMIIFQDLIRGEITFDTKELGDFVIAKSLTEPLYHLAVVADDLTLGVTHVIRGEDHISNTPRQILLLEALGGSKPIYAHLPLILAPDRSKLSKRHGAVSVLEYRARGFLPNALVNYLALLGWNSGTAEETFSLAELTKRFSLTKVQKAGAIFDLVKLNWLNREYLKRLSDNNLVNQRPAGADEKMVRQILPLIRERMTVLTDLIQLLGAGGEFDYFFQPPFYERGLLKNQTHFSELRARLETLPDDQFTAAEIKAALMPYADRAGRGEVLWPFRVALTGREKSTDPFTVAAILGKTETLSRLVYAENLV